MLLARLGWRVPILLAGWLLFLAYAYPGYTSPDTHAQLHEARTGFYTDWHPPFMAWLWGRLETIWTGTPPMLVAQSVCFLLGVDGILRRFLAPTRAAIATVAIVLFPPVLTTMACIWKDSQMAGYVLAGTAALLSPHRGWKLAGCVLLFMGTAVRHNAPAATLPIVVLLFTWFPAWTGWRRYALALAVWVGITGAAHVVNVKLTDSKEFPWHNSLAVFDIAGTIRYARVDDDAHLRELLAGTSLVITENIFYKTRKLYSPSGHYQLTHGEGRMFDMPAAVDMRAIEAAWWRTISSYPLAFARHRWRVFKELLGESYGGVWTGDAVEHGLVIRFFRWLEQTFVFRAYTYLLIGLALLVMCRSRLVLAILTSGLLCQLSLLAAAPSPDFRYSHWMITCTAIAAVATFVLRYRAGIRPARH